MTNYVYETFTTVFYKDGSTTEFGNLHSSKKKAVASLKAELEIYADDFKHSSDPIGTDAVTPTHFFFPSERQIARGATFVSRSVVRRRLY